MQAKIDPWCIESYIVRPRLRLNKTRSLHSRQRGIPRNPLNSESKPSHETHRRLSAREIRPVEENLFTRRSYTFTGKTATELSPLCLLPAMIISTE